MLLGSRSLGGKDDSFSAHDTLLLDRLAYFFNHVSLLYL